MISVPVTVQTTMDESEVKPMGSELPPLTIPKTAISQNRRAESGVVDDEEDPSDSDLDRLIRHWPKLPKETRTAIFRWLRGSFPIERTHYDRAKRT